MEVEEGEELVGVGVGVGVVEELEQWEDWAPHIPVYM